MSRDLKISTYFSNPPIPTRQYDWIATWADYFDGAPDDPVGYSATELDAIADLIHQTEPEYLAESEAA